MMSEKRFYLGNNDTTICDRSQGGSDGFNMLTIFKVVDLLNEQQATIQRMKHSLNTIYKAFEKHYGYDMRNAVWLIDELSYDEIVDELYIAETDSKNRKEASMYWKKKVDEQQSTINELKERNAHNFAKKMQLMKENRELRQQLQEKQEDEKLYAQEIVKLNKEAKEVLNFRNLGSDY